jgi:hypothetical protein
MVQVSNEKSKQIFSFILSLDMIQYGQSYPTILWGNAFNARRYGFFKGGMFNLELHDDAF